MSGNQRQNGGNHNGALAGLLAVGAAAVGAGLAYAFAHQEKQTLERELVQERKRGDGWQDRATSKSKVGECGICLDEAVGVAFDPCGHTVCTKCGIKVNLCPYCKVKIEARNRIYLS